MGASDQMAQAITEAQPTDAALQEGAAYSTATPENPLQRNIVVSVRASLNELCLQKQKGTWAPSTEALRSMFQQKVRSTHTRTTRRPHPTSPQPLTHFALFALFAEVHGPRRLRRRPGRPQGTYLATRTQRPNPLHISHLWIPPMNFIGRADGARQPRRLHGLGLGLSEVCQCILIAHGLDLGETFIKETLVATLEYGVI